MCPVLQPELQQCVIHTLGRTGVHLDHVLQEGFQLPWVVGKNRDELLRVGLEPKQTWPLLYESISEHSKYKQAFRAPGETARN